MKSQPQAGCQGGEGAAPEALLNPTLKGLHPAALIKFPKKNKRKLTAMIRTLIAIVLLSSVVCAQKATDKPAVPASIPIPADTLKKLQEAYTEASNAQFVADKATSLLLLKSSDCTSAVLDIFRREAKEKADAWAILLLDTKVTLKVPSSWQLDFKEGKFAEAK
jgi:hypothetical protein